MSETLGVVATENQTGIFDDFSGENADHESGSSSGEAKEAKNENKKRRNEVGEEIPDPLTPLIEANADVLVRCPWMNNEIVTLSAAVLAYSANVELITAENISIVAAIMADLLTNPVTEPEDMEGEAEGEEDAIQTQEEDRAEEEEPTQTEEVDQKSDVKTKAQEKQISPEAADTANQPKEEISAAKQSEVAPNRPEENVAPVASKAGSLAVAKAGAVTNFIQKESKRSTPGSAKAEGTTRSLNNSAAIKASSVSTDRPEVLAITSDTSGNSVRESVIETKGQVPLPEKLPEVVKENPIVKAESTPSSSQLDADGHDESHDFPLVVGINAESEPEELSPLDFETVVIPDDSTEIDNGKSDVAEDESWVAPIEHQGQTDADDLTAFVEDEILLDAADVEEVDLELDESDIFRDEAVLEAAQGSPEVGEETLVSPLRTEPNLSEQVEFATPEQSVQFSLIIEEVEDSLIQITEHINASEPETTERVNEILDKIIEVPAKLEIHNDESSITEAEVQAELEELFKELLDNMDIDHTPELIESLAYLIVVGHLSKGSVKPNNEEETEEAPQDTGTHEAIMQLLLGLSTVKKAMEHACVIGRSALTLSFSLERERDYDLVA